MKATVRHEMTEAVVGYEEKPRDQWLFDYPAQVNEIITFSDVNLVTSLLLGYK